MTKEQITNELGKFGYGKGNSVSVETLIDEIIPTLLQQNKTYLNRLVLQDVWAFCEKEFNADFEDDTVNDKFKKGLSDRTEKFVNELINKI